MLPRKLRMGLGRQPGADVQVPRASGGRGVEEFSASAALKRAARGSMISGGGPAVCRDRSG